MDSYWTNPEICLLPATATSPQDGIDICGPVATYALVGIQSGNLGGNVTIYQDGSLGLYITFQTFCPYIIRWVGGLVRGGRGQDRG